MAVRERLNAADLKKVIETFRDALVDHRESINALNVYPVPDGDTGTNMSLTLDSVVKELDGVDSTNMSQTTGAISHGSLMGARGNSGVILSQIMRGLSDRWSSLPEISATDMADALSAAAKAAYGAVLKPVEGTILTVVREVAETAETLVQSGTQEMIPLLEQLRAAGYDALERTPEQLPVLAKAGVVDAGGRGFLLLIDSLLHVMDGRALPEPDMSRQADLDALAEDDFERPDEHGSIADLRYEVMFFLDAPDELIDSFKQSWGEIGDSIVVVGGSGLWNCHIHTDHIGASIEAGIAVGRPYEIRVTDLLEELEHRESMMATDTTDGAVVVHSNEASNSAVVTVGAGDGIAKIFASLGAQAVVVGGQSMNPSTQLLLDAVQAVAADEVVILPNNKNIIPVAEQVDALTDKAVRVVPTRAIPEGFAALMSYDPGASADENLAAMTAGGLAIASGEVTQAVRDSDSDAGPIKVGDWLGIEAGSIVVVAETLLDATCQLLERMVDDDAELITLITGADAPSVDTEQVVAWVQEHRPDAEVEVHTGGQPLYPYFVGVE